MEMNVCQKCGDKGKVKDLIYCLQCKVFAQHRYCMEILPKSRSEAVVWKCEECTSTDDVKLGPVSSRKSERISQAAEEKITRKQMLKQMSHSGNYKARGDHVESSTEEAKKSRGDCLVSDEELKRVPLSGKNIGNEEQKRMLVLGAEDNSNADADDDEHKH